MIFSGVILVWLLYSSQNGDNECIHPLITRYVISNAVELITLAGNLPNTTDPNDESVDQRNELIVFNTRSKLFNKTIKWWIEPLW